MARFFDLSLLDDFAELEVVFVAHDPVVMLLFIDFGVRLGFEDENFFLKAGRSPP